MKTPLLIVSNFEFSANLSQYFFLSVTLSTVLSFVTGAEEIPPLGFPHNATLGFSETNSYPTASTCAIQLTLPFKYATYEDFRKNAMMNHGGFGLAYTAEHSKHYPPS